MPNLNKQATITNTPRNPILGLLADAIQPVKKVANNVNIPIIGPLGDFMLGESDRVVNDMANGVMPLKNDAFGSKMLTPDALELLNLTPLAGVTKPLAKMAGREIARQVQTGTGLVGRNVIDPRQNIVAYHGSPHTFDKFSLDKIGTGEGAQAYGHGLYFADSPEVAKSYMNPVVTPKLTDKEIQELVNLKIKSRKNVESLSNEEIYKINDLWTKHLNYEDSIKNYKQPSFYKVDIPDEAVNNMLLWDKPLSEQPKAVQDALSKLGLEPSGRNSNKLASDFYKELGVNDISSPHPFASRLPPSASGLSKKMGYGTGRSASSSLLNDYGISGIRYLDQGSRGAGQGTMNTVLFDDSLVKILERNGVPLSGLLD